MKVYLDSCAYNRPYDDVSNVVINLEAQAKLFIQKKIHEGDYELVTSEMLMKEISECPFEVRRNGIKAFIIDNSSIHVGPGNNEKIDKMARDIISTGIKYKDACHVASAMIAECDYFISTDKRLLKYKTDKLKLVNPLQFIDEILKEDEKND